MGSNPREIYHFVGFLTFSAWINGSSIKRYIGELIKEESKASRELIEVLITKLSDQQESMITKLSDQHENMTKALAEFARSAR